MCGISGIMSARPVEPALLANMAGRLRHRGPGDEGVWIDIGRPDHNDDLDGFQPLFE